MGAAAPSAASAPSASVAPLAETVQDLKCQKKLADKAGFVQGANVVQEPKDIYTITGLTDDAVSLDEREGDTPITATHEELLEDWKAHSGKVAQIPEG